MTNQQPQDLKTLKIIYSVLILGVTFFLFIVFIINQQTNSFDEVDLFFEQILLGISSLMAVISIASGIFLFNKRIQKIEELNFSEKLDVYRSAMIVRAATMEGSGFFFVVCYALTGSQISLAETLLILILMLYFFPTKSRLSTEMKHDLMDF